MEKRDKTETTHRPGILNAPPSEPKEFKLWRFPPAPELRSFIEHYWIVAWDLRARGPHTQETLPQPNVHIVFERNNSRVYGVVTGKFSRRIKGKSHVSGIRFAPGMFRSYLGSAVGEMENTSVPVRKIFGREAGELESILVSGGKPQQMVEVTDDFFRKRIPPFDENAEMAKRIVRLILDDRGIRTVDELVKHAQIRKRSLQRLFYGYVGASPKWVIRRYRLSEAVERFRAGECPAMAQLALELGYFDQAHLINDFRTIIGFSPTEFRKTGGSQKSR